MDYTQYLSKVSVTRRFEQDSSIPHQLKANYHFFSREVIREKRTVISNG